MAEHIKMTKAAGTVGGYTLISRVLGYVRDIIITGLFGAGPMADAFIAAFRIPNLFRRLLGEGTLSVSVIPVFADYINTKNRVETMQLVYSAFRILSILLAFLVVIGVIISPWIVRLTAFGFIDSPEKFSLTVALARIMMPYLFFIGIVALCMGILNAIGHFSAPSMAPILLNLSMIGSALIVSLISADPKLQIYGLAIGVVIGGVLQLALQIPFLIKNGIGFRRNKSFIHPGIRKIGSRFLPMLLGASVFQINSLISGLLASFGREGSVTYLYLADRLVQFPLGVFGIAIAIAVLPSFSRLASVNDIPGIIQTFSYSMKMVTFIIVPSMIGIIMLREPIVAFLFQRGAFSLYDTKSTAIVLIYYSIGLWAFAAVRIVISAFYAMNDTNTPIKVGVISIFANIILGVVLMRIMGLGGIAFSISIASLLNYFLLVYKLRGKLGSLEVRGIVKTLWKTVISSSAMGLVVWFFYDSIHKSESVHIEISVTKLFGCIIFGIFTYVLFSYILNAREIKKIVPMMFKGIR